VRSAGECDHIQILTCVIYNLFHSSLGIALLGLNFESICWPIGGAGDKCKRPEKTYVPIGTASGRLEGGGEG
jgi:hypothetical protein